MPWTPLTKIIVSQTIATNLLAYFAVNQADAILWAHGSALRLVQKFSDTVANRAVPVYPAVAFSDDNSAIDYTETQAIGAYSVVFEFMVESANPDTAISEARSYAKAFASMILNCPKAILVANTGAYAPSTVLQTMEIGFDPIKTNEQQNDFLQMFQIRTIFELLGE